MILNLENYRPHNTGVKPKLSAAEMAPVLAESLEFIREAIDIVLRDVNDLEPVARAALIRVSKTTNTASKLLREI